MAKRVDIVSDWVAKARESFVVSAERRRKVEEWLGRVGPFKITDGFANAPDHWFLKIDNWDVLEIHAAEVESIGGKSRKYYLLAGTVPVKFGQLRAFGLEPLPHDLFGSGNFVSDLRIAVCINNRTRRGELHIVDVVLKKHC